MKNNNIVILQLMTKSERDLWMRWYKQEGTKFFWGWMLNSGKRWRKNAERKLKKWPNENEKFVL